MSQALDPVTQRHVDNLAKGLVHEFAETVRRIRDELDQRVQKLSGERLAETSVSAN